MLDIETSFNELIDLIGRIDANEEPEPPELRTRRISMRIDPELLKYLEEDGLGLRPRISNILHQYLALKNEIEKSLNLPDCPLLEMGFIERFNYIKMTCVWTLVEQLSKVLRFKKPPFFTGNRKPLEFPTTQAVYEAFNDNSIIPGKCTTKMHNVLLAHIVGKLSIKQKSSSHTNKRNVFGFFGGNTELACEGATSDLLLVTCDEHAKAELMKRTFDHFHINHNISIPEIPGWTYSADFFDKSYKRALKIRCRYCSKLIHDSNLNVLHDPGLCSLNTANNKDKLDLAHQVTCGICGEAIWKENEWLRVVHDVVTCKTIFVLKPHPPEIDDVDRWCRDVLGYMIIANIDKQRAAGLPGAEPFDELEKISEKLNANEDVEVEEQAKIEAFKEKSKAHIVNGDILYWN